MFAPALLISSTLSVSSLGHQLLGWPITYCTVGSDPSRPPPNSPAFSGFSRFQNTAAISGISLGLVASRWAHLTGVASEESFVLSAAAPDLRLTSVVIVGIIVAGLGVLNDVTITQASAVWELADEGLGQRNLFAKAMRIGRDHIASTVYTIAFATAGAALSVLLLISIYDRPLLQVVQTEQFAGEIIRTLVGSIGLVLAVPLTTAVGVAVVRASHSAVAAPASNTGRSRRGARPEDRSCNTCNTPQVRRIGRDD